LATECFWRGATALLVTLLLGAARATHAQRAPEVDSSFHAVGVATGTPGYVNLVAAHYGHTLGVQASAGGWTHGRVGAQLAVVWRALRYPGFSVGPAAVLGTFGAVATDTTDNGSFARRRQVYLGPAVDIYLDGFHLQAGIALGLRAYPRNPQLVFQTGYLFRLR